MNDWFIWTSQAAWRYCFQAACFYNRNTGKPLQNKAVPKEPPDIPYEIKLFLLVAVSLVEFVDATCCVHEFHLACVERV